MFELGMLVATTRIADKIREDKEFNHFVFYSLERYKNCDWGDLDEEDKDFFSLVCAFEVDDMDQLELFYSAASEASREYRIAKAYIGEIEDECFEIRFCVEGLVTPELFRSNLRRYVELLLDMQESVFDACEEDDSDAE